MLLFEMCLDSHRPKVYKALSKIIAFGNSETIDLNIGMRVLTIFVLPLQTESECLNCTQPSTNLQAIYSAIQYEHRLDQ